MKSIKSITLHRRKSLIEKNSTSKVKTRKIDSIIIRQDSNIKRKYLFATNFALNNRKLVALLSHFQKYTISISNI
jgi:hypothetical protein